MRKRVQKTIVKQVDDILQKVWDNLNEVLEPIKDFDLELADTRARIGFGKWKKMSTFPKNDGDYLVLIRDEERTKDDRYHLRCEIGIFENGEWYDDWPDSKCTPLFWMHLPPFPKGYCNGNVGLETFTKA